MGVVISYEVEVACTIPASIVFKSVAMDFTNLLPKVLPQVVTSAGFLEGDGGVGSIRQIHYGQGESSMFVKERIDSIDEKKLTHSYTAIEGSFLERNLEKLTNEIKVEEDGAGGGSIIKSKTRWYCNMGDHEFSADELNVAKEQAIGLYKAIEAYLLANPDA